MSIKSLVDLCTNVCIKNIKEIQDVGNTPIHLLKPILMRIDSADHLSNIELASPHVAEDDVECWIRLIERDFPVLSKNHNFEPRDPTKWGKIYRKYKIMEEEQKRQAKEKLMNAFASIKQKKEANTSEVVTFDRRRMPKPPRDSRGDIGKKGAVGRRGGSNDTGELRFTGGTRTKVNNASSIMRRVKREAKEIHNRNRLATPNGALLVRNGQIRQAPQGMVAAEKVKSQPKIRAPVARPRVDSGRSKELEQREERLRKLKGNRPTTLVSDSELDNEDVDDEDDYDQYGHGGTGGLDEDDLEAIFDEPPQNSGPSSSSGRTSSTFASSKHGLLPNKPRGLLSNAPRSSPATVQSTPNNSSSRPPPKPALNEQPRGRTAPAGTASSPPLGPSSPPKPSSAAHGQSGSPDMKPKLPPKRKAASVFMAPKPKVQRR